MNLYQQFIHKSRYARYLEEEQRRENWGETVDRYINFFEERLDMNLSDFKNAILRYDVMPSMRCLMVAGKASDRDNAAGFNCSYIPIDSPRAFDEIMYVLMCGTGVGFSVERQYINQLPEVPEELHNTDTVVVVRDSKIGWATALRELISLLYSGRVPKWDLSRIRPSGARLKTFGGRASGPEPLDKLLRHVVNTFTHAKGRKLNSIECHDLVCYEGEAVVVGGVRRSATISLSNLTDERMRRAKSGQWSIENGQRSIANNSVAYTEMPDTGAFLREWTSLYESRSGERGIFNRQAAKDMVPERRDSNHEFGVNPCSEIVLRPRQFCNLSEVVCRPTDTLATLRKKITQATWIGTIQSTLTDFRYLSTPWKKNTEEERLLGVSLTGIMDCPALMGASDKELRGLRDHAVKENGLCAKLIGIPESTAVTCVKPSGTVSQLVDCASGIHPRHNSTFIRHVRNDKKDPMSTALIEAGVPYADDPGKEGQWAFSFPMKSPDESITRHNLTAIEHLTIWKRFALNWCEHKPSITVSIKEHEWVEVGAWVYENFNILSGASFLPHSEEDHSYQMLPYQDCTAKEYKALEKVMPTHIEWDSIKEEEDQTIASQEYACMAGECEI
jgi:ribonucleoside-diphosphate reductase alpha chain